MVFAPELSPLIFALILTGLKFYGFVSVPFDPTVDVQIDEAKHAVGLVIEQNFHPLGVIFMV